jgi:hypothetical protein
MEELYEQVVSNKQYRVFPRSFVEKLIRRNINKTDIVKETRKQLREVYLMYKGVRKPHDAEIVWDFLKANIKLNSISILDLGCGEMPKFIDVAERHFKIKSYTAVDIAKIELPSSVEFIIDDVTELKGEWLSKQYDLVLMLNLAPIIERIRRGSTLELISKVKTSFILLSLPLYSIGGRKYIGHYWKKWAYDNLRNIIASQDNKEMLILLDTNLYK